MSLTSIGTKLAMHKAKLITGAAVLAALVIAIGASYHMGYTKGEAQADFQIASYKADVQKLRADLLSAQGTVTERIVTEYVPQVIERTRIVTRNQEVIKEVVPAQWTLSKGWIYAYNQTVLGEPIDPDLAMNEEPSGIYDSTALDVIGQNNAIANENIAQQTALQQWIREQEEVANNASSNSTR